METADRQGIEVHCCPACAGIWLKAGTLESIVRRTLDAEAELEGPSRAVSFHTQTTWRSLKMKIIAVSALAVLGLLAVLAYGDEPKKFRVELAPATIGAVAIPGGQYTMLVHRDGTEPKVQFTDLRTGKVIDVAAKVQSSDAKFERTEVHSHDAGGARQITEIRLGGTNLTVDFRQGS
jgi:hypothetical protein